MKKIRGLILALFLAGGLCNVSAEAKGFYFYSQKDYENVKASANTPRGRAILDEIVSQIESRREHPLELPTSKAGRGHWYVCGTHNVHLKFDWNKPHEHWCSVCKKYLKGENLDAAWVKTIHARNDKYLRDCTWAYMATGDKKYAEYIRDMLLDYAKLYPTFEAPSEEAVAKDYHLSRMFDQWLDDCVWITSIAPAYMAAKEIMTDAEKSAVTENLFALLADQQMNRDGNNNWQVWNNCGRIHLGVVLENDDIIDEALNGAKGLIKAFDKEVNPDGWYNEASIGYHFFPLKGFLNAANAVLCRDINMFDAKFEKMFTSVMDATYSDLSVVAHNDSWYGESPMRQAPLYEFAYARMHTKFMGEILSQIYSKVPRNSFESLLNPDEIKPASEPLSLESKLFPQTGFAVLRDGKNAATMTFGESHGGHGHPHRLAITVHNGEKEVLPDIGTPGYGSPMYRRWYQKTLAHNTVLVDGNDQRFAGLPGKLLDFKSFSGGGSVEASADKAYQGVAMRRKIELKEGRLADEFKCASDSEHVYEYLLHLRDKPEILAEASEAVWNESEPYSFIKDRKTFKAAFAFKIKTKTAEIEISSADKMEIMTGSAPGPAIADAKNEEDVTVYTVIVKVRAKNLDIRADWNIK